jgi:hypothetical protein
MPRVHDTLVGPSSKPFCRLSNKFKMNDLPLLYGPTTLQIATLPLRFLIISNALGSISNLPFTCFINCIGLPCISIL